MTDPWKEPDNSTVDDWFGQSVDRDRELAEDLLEETGDPDEAEVRFDEEAYGRREQEARRGDHLDGGAA